MHLPSESEVILDSPELILWCFDLIVVDSLKGCCYNLQYTYQFQVMQLYNDEIYFYTTKESRFMSFDKPKR